MCNQLHLYFTKWLVTLFILAIKDARGNGKVMKKQVIGTPLFLTSFDLADWLSE